MFKDSFDLLNDQFLFDYKYSNNCKLTTKRAKMFSKGIPAVFIGPPVHHKRSNKKLEKVFSIKNNLFESLTCEAYVVDVWIERHLTILGTNQQIN